MDWRDCEAGGEDRLMSLSLMFHLSVSRMRGGLEARAGYKTDV